MEDFDKVLKSMVDNYLYLETIMGRVYLRLEGNLNNTDDLELFKELYFLADSSLDARKDFIYAYGPEETKTELISEIIDKKINLSNSFKEIDNNVKKR